jgi:4-hydroxy-tetrahydrodipicolinate reductase
MAPLRLLVNGAKGRMGQAIIACAKPDPEVRVTAEVDTGDDFAAGLEAADAVIEFSHHTVTAPVARACSAAGKLLVIGTTGHTDAELEQIRAASEAIPVVFAPNFSVGVNALFWLTQKAAEILGPDFDLEVIEMHHRLKKDAPSGTARRLAEILADARGLRYSGDVRHGREGITGERTSLEIGMHALRGGDVVGDHTVIFAGQGERIELTHKASSRDTFARGAIRAAKWGRSRPAGLFDMQDVLKLRKSGPRPPLPSLT